MELLKQFWFCYILKQFIEMVRAIMGDVIFPDSSGKYLSKLERMTMREPVKNYHNNGSHAVSPSSVPGAVL